MATTKAAKHNKSVLLHENEEVVEVKYTSSEQEHDRYSRVKHGQTRLDKRSAQGVSGQPKKSGQGGKYTWNGSLDDAALDDSPAALDENDPNYVDEDEADSNIVAEVANKSDENNDAQSNEKV